MRVIWKWKSNIFKYMTQPGVVGVRVSVPFKRDDSLQGRDGWVGFIDGDPSAIATENKLSHWWEEYDGRKGNEGSP